VVLGIDQQQKEAARSCIVSCVARDHEFVERSKLETASGHDALQPFLLIGWH
jgi:hypothetical protein